MFGQAVLNINGGPGRGKAHIAIVWNVHYKMRIPSVESKLVLKLKLKYEHNNFWNLLKGPSDGLQN